MKKLFTALAIAAATSSAFAASDTYTIDHFHTYPSFAVSHLGYSIQHGRFDKTSGTITLDLAAKTGSVDLTIDATSLDMGFPQWNEHLSGEGFFNTAKYPTITFKSTKLIFDGDKVVGADGDFTLLGVTRPIHLTVSNFKCGANPMNKKEECGAQIDATIKRSDFGMTKYVPFIGDEVRLSSPIEAYKN